MLLIFILLIVPIIVYAVRSGRKETEEFTKLAKRSRLLFISLAIIFSGLLALENINYYLVWYRSTSIVYLATTIAGIVYVLSERRPILSSFKRILLNFMAVIFMIGSALLTVVIIDDFNKQLVYSDSRFRVEFPPKAPMSPCGLPALFVKKGLVEQKTKLLSSDQCVTAEDILSVTIKEMETKYLVRFSIVDAANDNQKMLTVEYGKP